MTWTLVPCGINGCTKLHGVTRTDPRGPGSVGLTSGLGAADREDIPARSTVVDKDGDRRTPEVAQSVRLRGPRQPYRGPRVSPLRQSQAEGGIPPR